MWVGVGYGGTMSANVLREGEPRLGWMMFGHPDTPDLAVMLHAAVAAPSGSDW